MNDFPDDLIFFLIFGAVVLFQILRAHWRKRSARAKVKRGPATGEHPQAEPLADPVPVAPPWTPILVEGPRPPTTPASRRPPAAPAPRTMRRFARSALMGNRRAVQDAIVIATILRPCHAKRPHEVE